MISSLRGRKRKALVGNTNKRKKVEVIHYDMFADQSEPMADNANDFPGALSFRSAVKFSDSPQTSVPSWHAVPLYWPALGTRSFDRKGEYIRMKYILLKGYIQVQRTIYRTAHYRLVMLNCRNNSLKLPQDANNYLTTLYRNAEAIVLTSTAADVAIANEAHALHDFHKCVIDSDLNKDITRKVLLKGTIKPNVSNQTGVYYQVGSTSSSGKIDMHTLQNTNPTFYDIIPLKLTVKCDDFVSCEADRYFFCLETDYVGMYGNSVSTQPGAYAGASASPFTLNFFAQGYFTDS